MAIESVLLDINPFMLSLLDILRTLFDRSYVVKSMKNILENVATCKVSHVSNVEINFEILLMNNLSQCLINRALFFPSKIFINFFLFE